MSKKNLIIAFGISTAFLVGGGHTFATQIQKDESVKPVQIVHTQTDETTKQESKELPTQESKELPTEFSFTDEALFTTNGQPDYFANAFLNNQDLFSLLNMNATELKQQLATGKSVVEIASSKNVSKQEVIEVIAKAQKEVQFKGGETEETLEEYAKSIEVKVLHVIEYKSN
ncbi:hypothetical protein ACMGD3_24840 [Lysinibacillus sphaericus]|uniref:hypothetical protein n=1 Tax=Lysinibacillus sphaericus TaxID=1421 RepID=UPI001C5D77F2